MPSTRLRHRVPPSPAASARPTAPPRQAERPAPLTRQAPAAIKGHPATARPEPGAPPAPLPAPHADGGLSAGASAGFAGGLAMLAVALVLVAPRMRRRLLLDPAALRPVAFVALLERPG